MFENGLSEYPGWKISDGVYITLTPTILGQALMSFMSHVGNAFAVEATKLSEINALTTSEAVTNWLKNDMKVGW